MNLSDAIEHLRAMHGYSKQFEGVEGHEEAINAEALAVCLEALAEHARDGGAILREVNPKAYATLESCVESLAAYAHGGEWAPPKPIDTTKSAPPLTQDEGPPLKCSCGKPSQCVAYEPGWDVFRCECGVGGRRGQQP